MALLCPPPQLAIDPLALHRRQPICLSAFYHPPINHATTLFDHQYTKNTLQSLRVHCFSWMAASLHSERCSISILSQLGTRQTHPLPQTCLAASAYSSLAHLNETILQLSPDTDVATFASLLQGCSIEKSLSQGELLHGHITRCGLADNVFLNNLLVQMYSKCGSLQHARAVFNNMLHRNLYSWTIMLAAYSQNGSFNDARTVFAEMPQRNVVSWNTIIAGCAQNGHGKESLQLFGQMQAEGHEPDEITFISILDACASMAALEEGRESHASLVCNGCDSDVVVGNALVHMYGKCGSLGDATAVFVEMPQRNLTSWSAMIAGCTQNERGKEALQLYCQMQSEGFQPDKISCICILDACASTAALEEGREIHANVISNAWDSDVSMGNAIVNMYGKCESLDDAKFVFLEMQHRDVISWNTMITVSTQNGHSKEALKLFGQSKAEGFEPNKVTFICALDACANGGAVEDGQEIHVSLVNNRWESDVVLGTALINMYGKCKSLDDARAVFVRLPHQNVVTWSTIISACVKNGHGKEALQLFGQMQVKSIEPYKMTFICVLDACASLGALEEGREIHASIVCNGWESDIVVGTALVNMYGKSRNLDDAWVVFVEMPQQNTLSWNAMIAVCAQNGHSKKALQLFAQMQAESIMPDEVTFIYSLDACASMEVQQHDEEIHACVVGNGCGSLQALEEGREIHAFVVGNGWGSNVVVGTALVNMYGKCGSLEDARAVFVEMPQQDAILWKAMITACIRNGYGNEALQLFQQMQSEAFEPDEITLICILDACANMATIYKGREIHIYIVCSGWESDVMVGTALINMYGKCGSIDDAWAVFAEMPLYDVISWSAMISVYTQNGYGNEALLLLYQMETSGFKPNKVTFICALDACANVKALEDGRQIHGIVVGNGWESDVVLGNVLMNMYSKCNSIDDARAVFAEMSQWDVVSWTVMLAMCTQNGHGKEALKLFSQMQTEGFEPTNISCVCVLDACASTVALEEGQDIHACILSNGWESDIAVGNALINMYGKCGNLDDARAVFVEMPCQDLISWNAMIAACAQNGHGKEALQLFGQMQAQSIEPNEITFISVLTACSHVGLVADARKHFTSMTQDHAISPSVDHYVHMIDLLGRSGQLEKAEKLIHSMPCEPVASAWLSLLSSCRIHGDLVRGVRAANHVFDLDEKNASPYVLLANILAAADRQDDDTMVRKAIIDKGMKEVSGNICIEVENVVHESVRDAVYSQQEYVYAELQMSST